MKSMNIDERKPFTPGEILQEEFLLLYKSADSGLLA
jgi:plasmid maintenance system antidote protein VapI